MLRCQHFINYECHTFVDKHNTYVSDDNRIVLAHIVQILDVKAVFEIAVLQ
jgi:hypothetical protein